jgi:hypothetical protein
MPSRVLRPLLAVAIGMVGLMSAVGGVGASSGTSTDPDDNSNVLDIKTVTHADTASTITYTLETYDDWDPAALQGDVNSPPYFILWTLDLPGSNEVEGEDMCVNVSGPNLDFEVTGCGSDPTVFDSGTATKAGKVLTVAWDRGAIAAAGWGTPTGYDYNILAAAPNDDVGNDLDFAPDDGTYHHELDGTSTTTTTTVASTTTTVATTTTTTTVAPTTTTTTAAATQSAGTASDSTVVPGQRITVAGSGFAPNSRGRRFHRSVEVDLGDVAIDSVGSYRTDVVIPASATPGAHQIVVVGTNPAGGRHESITPITVLGGTLPNTGQDPRRGVGAGLLAVGGGTLLVAIAGLWRLRSYVDWP